MRKIVLAPLCALVTVAVAACSPSGPDQTNPELAPRGTPMTKVKPTRQDLTTKISITGKVEMNPTFGLVAPVAGEVRYFDIPAPNGTPTRPIRVATVWKDQTPNYVEAPPGSTFSGRLVDDKATVTAGMPIASAKHVGYAIVGDIDGQQAYKINGALTDVVVQIKNGPGPFPCAVLGTIAALPQGTIPEKPPVTPDTKDEKKDEKKDQPQQQPKDQAQQPSGSTGLRIVCTAPADVQMINGATASIEVTTGKSAQALVVPVEAVAGAQGKGKVDVIAGDGARRTTDVTLGLTDGKVIEIKSGLTGDEELAVPGPNLPEGQQQGGDQTKPTGP
ncbi:efflux RND transporter periplasmic adaptor subunit [Lentzea sp. NBC_00516]|uniref:efflux RND transporter periplasmic adaptor subunit n=1 Tax=Lentzea sp. NBC_00516 TaxID=2903582 RepID=UPI002E817F81|nr:efflux RND transporter periplasmic adaptor subunit [Lentzea sp. NBC_00516]WUD28995.1 efflux RND transporter periplasmic adaptor subunit [Lentzea sp. NBC_00516]